MGHNRFSTLPNSLLWRQVLDRLAQGADVAEVAALSVRAVEAQLQDAASDPAYREAIRLLALVPMAARADNPVEALRALGLPLSRHPGLTEIVFALGGRLDEIVERKGRRDDFAELSRRALVSAVSTCVGSELPGLIDATPQDVMIALRTFSNSSEFTRLSRAFYTRLLSDTLSSFLDRSLADHVGRGARFADVGARSAFDTSLKTYCYETTRIIHEFSRGWHGKNAWAGPGLSEKVIAGFGSYALTKILAELRRKEPALG